MKKTNRIISVILALMMVLTIIPISSVIHAGAVTVKFITDNAGKNYIEEFEENFSCIERTATSAKIKISCKDTIYANYYDTYQYDFEVRCNGVTTGRQTIVPAQAWKNKSNVARSLTKSATLTVPINTPNQTTIDLVCLQYQCSNDGKGTIRYTEREKPGTVKFTVPKYTAPATTYTLSYNANGGSGAPANQTGAVKYTVSSAKPTRSGYNFLGWAKSSSAKTAEYTSGSSITLSANTTLYAVWSKVDTTNIYNLGEETYSFKNFTTCKKENKRCNGYGHCYGMSVTSAAYYNNILSKETVGYSASKSVYNFSNTAAVKVPICYYQIRQGSSTIVAGGTTYYQNIENYKPNLSSDWTNVVNYVKNNNYNNKGNLIISFREDNNKTGKELVIYGHATDFLYYKEVNGQQRIYIYDSNFPDVETYLYKGSDGKVYQAPKATLKNINCVAVRSLQKCISYAGDFDGTHVIYAEAGTIEVEGATAYTMDCGNEVSYVAYEIPENYCEVFITPLTDNAEFTYLDETYSFGEVGEDTYGFFTLASNYDGSVEDNQRFSVSGSNIVDDVNMNYKSSYKINVNVENLKSVKFESSDTSIVTVDNNGVVKSLKNGTATINYTATDANGTTYAGTCNVNVSYAWWQWLIKIVLFGWIWY